MITAIYYIKIDDIQEQVSRKSFRFYWNKIMTVSAMAIKEPYSFLMSLYYMKRPLFFP